MKHLKTIGWFIGGVCIPFTIAWYFNYHYNAVFAAIVLANIIGLLEGVIIKTKT